MWKQRPIWLKGGITAVIVFVFLAIIILISYKFQQPICSDKFGDCHFGRLPLIIAFLYAVSAWFLTPIEIFLRITQLGNFGDWFNLAFYIFYIFCIGSFFGWLYGKIKYRDKPPSVNL